MFEVTVGTVRSRTRITREGQFEEYYEVEYFVDDARYTLEMSPEGFTALKTEEAVKKHAAEFVAIKGKKITISK